MLPTHHARAYRALTALVLLAIWASVAAGLWATRCGPSAAQPAAPLGPTVQSQPVSQGGSSPACEIRALPLRPTVALASVVEALPAAPALTLDAPATATVVAPARDTLPVPHAIAPLQHPPNPVS